MKNYLVILFSIVISTMYSQSITLDPSFGDNGYSEAITIPSFDSDTDTVLLPNGQLITGHSHSSSSLIRFKKINQNGTVDTSFNNAFNLGSGSFVLFKKLVFYNNKLIIAGMGKTTLTADYDLLIARFNLDGSLDTTFGNNGYTLLSYGSSNDEPIAILNDANGNNFIYTKHSSSNYIAKFDSNGIIDNSFGTNGILLTDDYISNSNKVIDKVALQTDGKFLFAGAKRNTANDNYESFLERKLQDGTYDTTFGNNGEVIIPNSEYCYIRNFEYNYADNSILLLHEFSSSNFTQDRIFLSKIQISDGALLTSFANSGMTTQYIFSGAPRLNLKHIKTLTNSKMLVTGSLRNNVNVADKLFTMRFDSDGNIDSYLGNDYYIFNTTPPGSSMRADRMPRLFDLDNGSFILAYSGGSVTHGSRTYLTKFSGATLGLDSFSINENDDFVIIFPNPTKSYIIVKNKLSSSENFNFKILDVLGRITKKGTSRFNEKIKFDDLINGTYIIYISTESGEQFSKKVVVK